MFCKQLCIKNDSLNKLNKVKNNNQLNQTPYEKRQKNQIINKHE